MGHTPLGTYTERGEHKSSDDFQELLPLQCFTGGLLFGAEL